MRILGLVDFFFNELMEYGPCKYSNEISRACEYLEDEGILEGSRVDFKDYEQEQILQNMFKFSISNYILI